MFPPRMTSRQRPYLKAELDKARENLKALTDGGVKSLHDFFEALSADERTKLFPFDPPQIIRRKDFVDLFDTTPDLSGNDIDVSPFIREGDERDVQVFWRDVGPRGPTDLEPSATRRELCNVPIGEIKAFLDRSEKRVGYAWDHLDEKWRPIRESKRELRPGLTILLPASGGGYSALGWDVQSNAVVASVPLETSKPAEGTGDDPNSCGPALTIADHTQHVCDQLAAILNKIDGLTDDWPGQPAQGGSMA